MIMSMGAIAAGGALGALTRHFVNAGIASAFKVPFPLGIMSINILGSFIMGALIALFAARLDVSQGWRLFLVVGFLGSFTTFSTFSLDTMTLITKGEWFTAALYVGGSVVLSIAAVFAGSWVIWKFFA